MHTRTGARARAHGRHAPKNVRKAAHTRPKTYERRRAARSRRAQTRRAAAGSTLCKYVPFPARRPRLHQARTVTPKKPCCKPAMLRLARARAPARALLIKLLGDSPSVTHQSDYAGGRARRARPRQPRPACSWAARLGAWLLALRACARQRRARCPPDLQQQSGRWQCNWGNATSPPALPSPRCSACATRRRTFSSVTEQIFGNRIICLGWRWARRPGPPLCRALCAWARSHRRTGRRGARAAGRALRFGAPGVGLAAEFGDGRRASMLRTYDLWDRLKAPAESFDGKPPRAAPGAVTRRRCRVGRGRPPPRGAAGAAGREMRANARKACRGYTYSA